MHLKSNTVLASAEFIASKSRDVILSESGVRIAAQEILKEMVKQDYSTAQWKEHPLNPKSENVDTLDWIFLVDLLNFSFWTDVGPPFSVLTYTGYWSLCAVVNRALDEGFPISKAVTMRNLTRVQFDHIFRSDSTAQVPLADLRYDAIVSAGHTLQEKWEGSFVNCVKAANNSALKLMEILVEDFPSFRDWCEFEGQTVVFLKRAQIMVADIWAAFSSKGLGEFSDIGIVTMFADYRVPQALVAMGALEYSQTLLSRLRKGDLMPVGDVHEVEIRGCSIWAVEQIRREIASLSDNNRKVNAILIDFYLWDFAKAHPKQLSPIPTHRTRSMFY